MAASRVTRTLDTVQNSRSTQRGRLLQEADIASRHVLDLYFQANALTAACCLPAEILVEIFMSADLARSTTLPLRWMHVTHVCRYWREVALHAPTLWTNILPFGDNVISMAVGRAGSLPLRLCWDIEVSGLDIDAVLPYSDRCVELDLTLSPYNVHEVLQMFQTPWPNLESFALARARTDRRHTVVLTRFWGVVSPTRLQHLRLDAIELPRSFWTNPPTTISSLRYLHLLNGKSRHSPSMDNLLDVLQSCVSLEELRLDNVQPPSLGSKMPAYPLPTRKVALLGLRELELLFAYGINLAHFLAHLDLSSRTRVALHECFVMLITAQSHRAAMHCLPRDKTSFVYLDGMTSVCVHHDGSVLQITASRSESFKGDVQSSHFSLCTHDIDRAGQVMKALRELRFLFDGRGTPTTVTFKLPLAFLRSVKVVDWQEALASFTSATRLVFDRVGAEFTSMGANRETQLAHNALAVRRFLEALERASTPLKDQVVPDLQVLHFRGFERSLLDAIKNDLDRCIVSRGARFQFVSD